MMNVYTVFNILLHIFCRFSTLHLHLQVYFGEMVFRPLYVYMRLSICRCMKFGIIDDGIRKII